MNAPETAPAPAPAAAEAPTPVTPPHTHADSSLDFISPASPAVDTPAGQSAGEPLAASTPAAAPPPAAAAAASASVAPHTGIPLPASAAGMKPSGIRPPSRIARPCSVEPKPALPLAAIQRATSLEDVHEEDETQSSSPEPDTGSVRKFSKGASGDAVMRRSLSDSREGGSSRSSACGDAHYRGGANDGWASARRLSEAGVRRSSDTSVVLTEDTDSFIIGDRVWVGGTKPGKIAYIGTTQFAPGEWAGVVLDDPVGKNDGSVAGNRYFQCEPRRGVFSRLTRLTRAPLPPSDLLAGTNGAASGASSPVRPRSSLVSPASSIRDLAGAAGRKSSSSSLAGGAGPLKLGERVIVMSSMGSKAGVLRYMGATDFAPGDWCGVELDDPLGKNDGSVGGRRYFDCQPKFGLFAPAHKVSKSPSSRRPSAACALHHPNAAGSGLPLMKRTGSRESIASSVASSAMSSVRGARVRLGVTSLQKSGVRTPTTPATSRATLQETLKEKDVQIERLLQERKLDRAEVIRAATQIEEAELKLGSMRQDFDKYRGTAEMKLREMQDLLARARLEKTEIASLLDDEKRKVEDLQFRFEEESITKGDIEVTSAEQGERIASLETELAAERARAETLERDSNKLFEAEETLARLREEHEQLQAALRERDAQSDAQRDAAARAHASEIDALRRQLQAAGDGANALAHSATKADQEYRAAIETLLKEKEAVRVELTNQLKDATATHEIEAFQLRKKLEDLESSLNAEIAMAKQKCVAADEELAGLRRQLEDSQTVIKLKSQDLEKGNEATRAIETLLKKQIEDAQASLAKTLEELEIVKGVSQEKDNQVEQLKNAVTQAESSLKLKTQELESQISSADEQLAEIRKKAEETQALLVQKTEELELAAKTRVEETTQKDVHVQKMEEKIKNQKGEIQALSERMKALKEKFEAAEEETKVAHTKALDEKNAKLSQIEITLSEKDIQVTEFENEVTKQKNELQEKTALIQKQVEDISALNGKLSESEASSVKLDEKVKSLELEMGDLYRKLAAEEEKSSQANAQKLKLEQDISELMSTSSDSSQQLTKLNTELREKERELEKIKEEMSASNRETEAVRQKLQQVTEQADKSQLEFQKRLEDLTGQLRLAEEVAGEKLKQAEVREQQLEQQLKDAVKNLHNLELTSKEQLEKTMQESEAGKEELNKKLKKNEEVIEELEGQLCKILQEASAKEEELNQKVVSLSQKIQVTEEELKEKTSLLQANEGELKAKLQKMLEEGKKLEDNLKLAHQQEIEALKLQLAVAETAVSEKDTKIASVNEEIMKIKQEKEKIENSLAEKDAKLLETLKELQKVQELKSAADNAVLEKSGDVEEVNNQLSKVKQENVSLQAQVVDKDKKISVLKEEFEKEKAEKIRFQDMIKTTESELSKVSEAFSILKETHATTNMSSVEKEAKLQQLLQELSDATREKELAEVQLKETSGMLVDATTQLAALVDEKASVDAQLEERNKKLLIVTEEVDRLKASFDKHKEELEGKLEISQKEAQLVQDLKNALESEKQHVINLESKLITANAEHSTLSERCTLLEKTSETSSALEVQVLTLQQELAEATKREEQLKLSKDHENAELKSMLEMTKGVLVQKEKECHLQKTEVAKLQEDKEKAQKYKTVLEKLENEKGQLEKKVFEMNTNVAESQANANSTDPSYQKLIEDKELAQGQIDFLNSVIVDMQQKNNALKVRLEVLELGILPSDASDLIEEGITKRLVPPRLFCDICDQFDLHDTDDCPRQATESPTPPTSNNKHAVGARSNIQERPYCIVCEKKKRNDAANVLLHARICMKCIFQFVYSVHSVFCFVPPI